MTSVKKVRFCDKLLPDQHEHTYYLKDGPDYVAASYDAICRSSGIPQPRRGVQAGEYRQVHGRRNGLEPGQPAIPAVPDPGIRRQVRAGDRAPSSAYRRCTSPRRCPRGEVVTIERFDHFAAIAQRNFAANGPADRITLMEGDAFEIIEKLPKDKKFYLIFIDGNKERYKDYFVKTEPLLAPRGISLVDDCYFHGDAINRKPTNKKGDGVRAMLDYAKTGDDYLRVVLPRERNPDDDPQGRASDRG